MQVPLIKGDKISIETDYRDALPVNMFAVSRPILGAQGYMLCYPGLTKLGDGVGLDRGGVYNERLSNQYRVSGGQLISVDTGGAVVNLGAIPDTRQVAMPYSFNTQAVIGNDTMYLYDMGVGFREVVDARGSIDGTWINGSYFLTDGEYLYYTTAGNEDVISPLTFATAEFMPDPSLGVAKTQDNKVLVFGRYTLEYFIDVRDTVAATVFGFQRVETRAQKIGIVATHAKVESGSKWYITGGRKDDAVSVHAITVGNAQKVATREVDKVIAQYTEPELADIRMETRMEDNVVFVLIHLPKETLCFNETIAKVMGIENAWTILKSRELGQATYRAINGIMDARSAEWVYGDKRDQTIGLLDNTVFTEYDARNEWLIYTPFMKLEAKSINKIEMETIPGHTNYLDATVAYSLSYDGVSYGTEWFKLYGNPLDYHQRFIIRKLGYCRDWIGMKFRGATKSRMSFAMLNVDFS